MERDSFTLYFYFFIIFFSTQSLAQTNGTIPVTSSLTATENSTPWLSPSNDFAFGFQFIRQSGLFLLSIWYHKLPEKTIVWYPLPSKLVPRGSKLDLSAQFGLVLTDPQGNRVWSSTLKRTTTTIDHGFINDTGNFVLMGPNFSSLWESFENPSNTLLPTQKMEILGVLNARKSYTDFSQGRFQFRLSDDGNAILTTINHETLLVYDSYYSTNRDDSSNSSDSTRHVVFEETGHLFIVKQYGTRHDVTDSLATQTGDFYYRATLDFDGVFIVYRHPKKSDNSENWTVIWYKPDDICDAIISRFGSGACGYNSICMLDTNKRPNCQCPQGYSLLDPNDTYGGCNTSFVQSCDEKGQTLDKDLYGIVDFPNTDWPLGTYERMESTSEEFCRNACLNDCFCPASVLAEDGFCWKKRLPLQNGRTLPTYRRTGFLKIKKQDILMENPDSVDKIPGPRRKKNMNFVGYMFLGSSVFINFVLLSVGLFSLFHNYKKKTAKPVLVDSVVSDTNLRAFSYEVLVAATNGFTEELGRGSFGIIYKGILDMGDIRGNVAIKKLDIVVQDSEKEFRAEVNIIGHTHHKNLVRLIGFCNHGANRLLVYEYMTNGTLASFLFGETKPSWSLRTKIALGIARGLLYLHEECTTQIIHCDIKPQNILLDDYYNGRIADFGLAKLLMIDQSHTDTAIRGTKGYVAPEWFRNIPVTVKVDVYSFGVLLLEIVTCRKSIVMLSGCEGGREILVEWVWDCFQLGKLEAFIENDVEALNDWKVVERFVLVGIWCIQEDPCIRPDMRKVSQMLEGVVEVTDPPCPWPIPSF